MVSHKFFLSDVFPMNFEGGKFVLNKALSNHFQVSHTVNFTTVQPPGYRLAMQGCAAAAALTGCAAAAALTGCAALQGVFIHQTMLYVL